MAFQGVTPEFLLDRSDSKNPATTCKGLTANGRPCRRGLGSTPGSSPNYTPTRRSSGRTNLNSNDANEAGVVAIIDSTNAAAFFCWQHKDQAQNLIARIESQHSRQEQSQQQQQQQQQEGLRSQRTRIIPLQKRSSIDTLVEKVGIIDLDGDINDQQGQAGQVQFTTRRRAGYRPENVRIRKRETLPPEWQRIQGPLMSVPEEVVNEVAPYPRIERTRSRSRSRTRLTERDSRQQKLDYSSSRVRPKQKASWSCCGLADDGYNDDGPPMRRRERYEERRPSRSQSRPRPGPSTSRPASYGTNKTSPLASQPAMSERFQRPAHIYNPRPDPRQDERPHRSSKAQITPIRQRPIPNPTQLSTSPFASSSTSPPHTQTSHLLSLIPPHLDPTTTSALLTELSKPLAKDDDAGYIYIYWLTPSSSPSTTNPTAPPTTTEDKPDDDIASTILDSDSDSESDYQPSYRPSHQKNLPSNHHHNRNHRTQTKQALLTRYASIKQQQPPPTSSPTTQPTPPKILLKIGRATNVHRRMTQWSKQCGQNITLIRYYPYKSSSSSSSSNPNSNSNSNSQSNPNHTFDINDDGKVPHVNKVERLIHVELRGLGMGYDSLGKKCEVCGRGHREWFEVEGTREGLRGVDGVVRRWVGWGVRSEIGEGVR